MGLKWTVKQKSCEDSGTQVYSQDHGQLTKRIHSPEKGFKVINLCFHKQRSPDLKGTLVDHKHWNSAHKNKKITEVINILSWQMKRLQRP